MNLAKKIEERKNSFSFITTNKDIQIAGCIIATGSDLPIDEKEMIKAATEEVDFEVAKIIRNICLIIGLDPDFPLFEDYHQILEDSLKEPFDYALALAFHALENGEPIDGLGFFKAAKIFKNDYFVNFNIGRVYYLLYERDYKEALPKAQQYLLTSFQMKKKPETAYLLTIANYNLSNYQQSLEYAIEALKMDLDKNMESELLDYLPLIEDKVYYERGYKAITNGRYQEGLENLLAISENGEDDWRVQFFLGIGYRASMQFQNAVMHLNKARDLNPNQVDIYTELGNSLLSLGDIESAKAELAEGLKLFPTEIALLLNMSIAQLYDGNLDLAHKFLEQAKAIDADHPDISTVEVALAEQKRNEIN